jgi:hypothetical protein
MSEEPRSPRFRARPLVSLLLALSFLVLSLSGLLMYFWSPAMSDSALGLGRGQWKDLHTVLSFVVVATAVLHMYLNWRTILCHIVAPLRASRRFTREAAVALVLMAAITAGTLLRVPPFSALAGAERHGPPPGMVSADGGGPGGPQGATVRWRGGAGDDD